MFDEQALIAKAAAGDPVAFRRLVEEKQANIRGLLLRLTGYDQARVDELAQDVFLQLYRKLASFRGESSLDTWLYRVSYNLFLDQERRPSFSFVAAEEEGSYSPQEQLSQRKDLQSALLTLSEKERTAVLLTSVEELTHEEAAKVMDVPLGSLKTYVARGKDQLKNILGAHP